MFGCTWVIGVEPPVEPVSPVDGPVEDAWFTTEPLVPECSGVTNTWVCPECSVVLRV